jgi:hypothetical protein
MKVTLSILLSCCVLASYAQNKEIKIQYGLELVPNHPKNEHYTISDEVTLQKSESELLKNQDEFITLEKFYLNGINYTFEHLDECSAMLANFNFDNPTFINPKSKEKNVPYLTKSGDTTKVNVFSYAKPFLYQNKHCDWVDGYTYDEYGEGYESKIFEVQELNKIISSIKFNETWRINEKGSFTKKIMAYSLGVPALDRYKVFRGITNLAYVLNNNTINANNLFKSFEYDVIFSIRQSDEESTYLYDEQINSPSYYHFIYPESRKEIITPLVKQISSGEIDIYYMDKLDKKGNPVKVKDEAEKMGLCSIRETIYMEDEYGDPTVATVVVEEYMASYVVGFRFVEDWYLDEVNNSFYKKVKYYAPLIFIQNDDGYDKEKTKALFWIKSD